MIDIQWKGKVGYGDIVSPICYAHNVSHKLQEKVNLTFRWEHGPEHKIHPSDPEALWERACFIEKLCYKGRTDVNITHKFKDPLNINHTNYDWDVVGRDRFHNYWFPKTPNKPSSNIIVVNSTEGNTQSLKDYGKAWKDPAAPYWSQIVDKLTQQGYDVVVVDYRTPTHLLIDMLKEAKGFVGYHGTAAWPAKFMHVPSVLFASKGSLTSISFGYAVIEDDATKWVDVIENIELYFQHALEKTSAFKKAYKTYMPDAKFLGHLIHD